MSPSSVSTGDQIMNDPKYRCGPIINTASGEAIPQDEPCFIFRARDVESLKVLEFYWELAIEAGDQEHADAIKIRIEEFYAFKEQHPERMKRPDTDLAKQGTYGQPKDGRPEETSERVGRIAAEVLAAPDTEDVEIRMPYHRLLKAAKSLAGSALTQRPDRG